MHRGLTPLVCLALIAVACGGSDAKKPSSASRAGTGTTVAGAAPESTLPGGAPAAPGATTPSGGHASPTPTARTGSPAPAGVTLTASDTGVTAKTIKVGVLIQDVSDVKALGFCTGCASFEDWQRYWNAAIDRLNKHGGILGRTVVADYASYTTINNAAASQAAACIKVTEDEKSFAVITQTFLVPLCITEQHKTPLLSSLNGGYYQEAYDRSNGLLYSLAPSGNRTMIAFANALHQRGSLKGKTVGVVSSDLVDPNGNTVKRGLIDTLGKLGYTVAHYSRLSADPGTEQSQVPVEIQQMRAAKVDAIIWAADPLGWATWTQQAAKQVWTPSYFLSEWGTMNQDLAISLGDPSTDGAMVLTTTAPIPEARAGEAERPTDAACRAEWEADFGKKASRESTVEYAPAVEPCGILKIFAAAAAKAGPNLTRAGFAAAMQSLGNVAMPEYHDGSFTKGKFGGADWVRWLVYKADCKCLHVASPFQRLAE
jgi:ABC-type branched-subunit amino acid transport system substrate-binding protein